MKFLRTLGIFVCFAVAYSRAIPLREENNISTRDKRQMKEVVAAIPQAEMKIYATPIMAAKTITTGNVAPLPPGLLSSQASPFGQFSNYAGLLFSGYPAMSNLPANLPTAPNTGLAPNAPMPATLPSTGLPNASLQIPTNLPLNPVNSAPGNNNNFVNPFTGFPTNNANAFQGNPTLYGGFPYPSAPPYGLPSAQTQYAALEQLINMANMQGLGTPFAGAPTSPFALPSPNVPRIPTTPLAPVPFAPLMTGYFTPMRL